jgi:hypothetical protein
MTATRSDIAEWLEEGRRLGATHIIIAVDRFDHENYPIYVMPGERPIDKRPTGEMQGVDECYDLRKDILSQMAERRAHHWDV